MPGQARRQRRTAPARAQTATRHLSRRIRTGAKADSDDTKKSDTSTKPDDDADSVDQDDSIEQPTGDDEGDVGTPPVDTEVDGEVNDNVATDTKDADRRRAHDRSPATEKTQDQRAVASVPAETVEKRDESETAQVAKRDVEENVEETNEPPADQHAAPDQVTVTVTPVVENQAAPTTPPSDHGVVETVAAAVSSAFTSLLKPFASNTTPDVPAAEPQFWTLAAASRREFETAFVSPSLVEDPVDEPTTSEVDIAAVESTLTYTPPPTFRDQITLAFYEVFRVVSKVTGIPVYAVLGGLLASADPPHVLTWGLDAQRTVWTAEDGTEWKVWEFAPPEPTEKTVIAFHGGGWIFEANILNWIDYTSMARQTGATVVVPLYPLATTPDGAATEIIPEAADFIDQQMALRGGADNVSLYADSAGSLIAISAVRELLLAGKPVPSSMVLLSLVADSTLSNPDIRDVDDPFFDLDTAQDVFASHWYDGITDRRDPSVSPLFFEPEILAALPPTTIYVGEREILYPDTLLLQQRAVEEGAPISVVVGTGLVHDWPSSGLSLIGSQTGVRPDIYRQLGLTDEPAPAPTLINVIGSLFFGLFDTFAKIFAGPPSVPANYDVRVARSALEIDCGDGYTTEADWYVPMSQEPPQGLWLRASPASHRNSVGRAEIPAWPV